MEIKKGSWPTIPVFNIMKAIGNIDEKEMLRAFNMGIGMVFIVRPSDVGKVKDVLKDLSPIYEIGHVKNGSKNIFIK